MPFSIFRKLGLGEPKPTTITLQLADRSIKYPRGIVEDVLVKVNKFIFPVDFIVLDMEEDYDVPLILGKPFLAIGGALIDVQHEKLILRVQDEQVIFNVFKDTKQTDDNQTYFLIDIIDNPLYENSVENRFETIKASNVKLKEDAIKHESIPIEVAPD